MKMLFQFWVLMSYSSKNDDVRANVMLFFKICHIVELKTTIYCHLELLFERIKLN